MINWWKKGIFDDLKPFDILPLESFLDRYQAALKTFPRYHEQIEHGAFFLGIEATDTSDPDVKYFHEKYNHPSCDLTSFPRQKVVLVEKGNRNFSKPEYYQNSNIKFNGNTTNYNGRDGQIRGGWATPTIEKVHIKPIRDGVLTGNWIYLTIPHELLYNYMHVSANGAPFDIAKKFVLEVESTIGWEDLDKVKKVVEEYDEKYPDWNHDFPINGYIQMKRDGLLFPAVWVTYRQLCQHSFHRMAMTSFNKMDFPFILPVPAKISNKWYASSTIAPFLYEGKMQYLTAEIDCENKKVTYGFTEEPRWGLLKNRTLLQNINE